MSNLIKVAVGAGHEHGVVNGDPGAIGINGTKEADLTYSVATSLYEMLQKDGRFDVLFVEPSVALEQRPKLVNQFGALLYTELHFNAFNNPSAKGTEALDYNGTGVGYSFSKSFTEIMAQREGLVNRGVHHTGQTFCVIRETTHDAVIPEFGFITNPDDYSHFDEPQELKELAYYCYLAFCAAFNLQPKAEIDPYYVAPQPQPDAPSKRSKYFNDIPDHMAWIIDSLDRDYERGIMRGDGSGNFNATANLSRGEMAVIIDRAVEFILSQIKK